MSSWPDSSAVRRENALAPPGAVGLRVGRGFDSIEKISDLNVQNLGQFNDRGQGRAALAAEDLRQVPLGEVGFEVKPVERAILLNHDLPQSSAE